ncbi:MAG: 2-amino-4-hydroxy-6-hydroxymethyldihydropteridine diphosphokinase, partial [Ramlibacter sp.]
MREAVTAYVGVGANLGDPAAAARAAIEQLRALPATTIVAESSLYRTAPVDSGGPDYINAVAQLSTQLTAPELLRELQRIENAAGRERPYRNAPRTLDLDLLLFGSARIESAELQVPHPRMWERA